MTRNFRLSLRARLTLIALFFLTAAGGMVAGAMAWVREQPANISLLVDHRAGSPVHLTIQTVGALGDKYSQPDWVSYLVRAPGGKWVHSTQWILPAHTRIDVTEYEYDSGSPLRNEVWGRVSGVLGGSASVQLPGSKHLLHATVINSYAGQGIAHTFTVPSLGINVPFYGVNGDAKNFCNEAPCPTSAAHVTVRFAFQTPGPGQYRWQCFIPCGVGFADGNGGPMDTLGFMAGYLKVVSA